MGRIECGNGWSMSHADAFEALCFVGRQSVASIVTDPPYSSHVHGNERSSKGAKGDFNSVARLDRDLGFDHITPEQIREASAHFARVATRWVIVFTDAEESL